MRIRWVPESRAVVTVTVKSVLERTTGRPTWVRPKPSARTGGASSWAWAGAAPSSAARAAAAVAAARVLARRYQAGKKLMCGSSGVGSGTGAVPASG